MDKRLSWDTLINDSKVLQRHRAEVLQECNITSLGCGEAGLPTCVENETQGRICCQRVWHFESEGRHSSSNFENKAKRSGGRGASCGVETHTHRRTDTHTDAHTHTPCARVRAYTDWLFSPHSNNLKYIYIYMYIYPNMHLQAHAFTPKHTHTCIADHVHVKRTLHHVTSCYLMLHHVTSCYHWLCNTYWP